MARTPKLYKQAFLTGCDYKTEWMLEWFVDNFRLENPTIPLVFADFGVKPETLKKIKQSNAIHAVMDFSKEKGMGWFLKPLAMLNCPAEYTVWIDTDCEVLGNLNGIFKHIVPHKLSMVEDRPWSKRRQELWHNSGVVGFHMKPEILKAWWGAVKKNPQVGDQEVLHSILDPLAKLTYIEELPNIYNWLRLQLQHDNQDNPEKLVMHWTGQKGKDIIRTLVKDQYEYVAPDPKKFGAIPPPKDRLRASNLDQVFRNTIEEENGD